MASGSRITAVAALAAAALFVAAAQVAHGDEAEGVVQALMFYEPTCPHCHEIITTVLPELEEQYGDRFEILLINTDAPGGTELFVAALDQYGVPNEDRGVPAVFIGDVILIGDQINAFIVQHIDSGIAQGGSTWPAIVGLEAALPELGQASDQAKTVADMSVSERLLLDPTGGAVAVVVLGLMIASVLVIAFSWMRDGLNVDVSEGWRAWFIPLLALLGLAIAAYLAYVETTASQAICGPVGDCNTVQQSPYARLFGVMPIGVVGVAGYLVILALWAAQRYGSPDLAGRSAWMLPAATMLGTLFSIYLTFLEPFVIGAVCMWCVTSAVIMTALLWASSGVTVPSRSSPDAGAETGPEPETPATDEDVSDVEGPGVVHRVLVALSYLVAAAVGVMIAAGLVHLYKTQLTPSLVMSVEAANRRVMIENAMLVGGLVLGPLAWHMVRVWWSGRT